MENLKTTKKDNSKKHNSKNLLKIQYSIAIIRRSKSAADYQKILLISGSSKTLKIIKALKVSKMLKIIKALKVIKMLKISKTLKVKNT